MVGTGHVDENISLYGTASHQVLSCIHGRRNRESEYASMGMWHDPLRRIPPIGFFLVEIRVAGPCRGASTDFTVASGGVLSEGYGHSGPGVCLGNGQTEAEGVPSHGGRGDALPRRMTPHLFTPS